MMRTMPGERKECENCLHCGGIFADLENRLWTVCDLKACIYRPRIKKAVIE